MLLFLLAAVELFLGDERPSIDRAAAAAAVVVDFAVFVVAAAVVVFVLFVACIGACHCYER